VQHPILDVVEAQERNLSWLARKTGKSPSYVLRVTQGSRRPSEDFKVRAAEALGVPVALLFPEPPTEAAA
jgi:transcriptional regulator with XRE-family HTH domain